MIVLCAQCGREFETDAYKLAHGRGRFCSKPCQHASLRTHGEANRRRTVEYATWRRMKTRCLDVNSPDYKDYGGRGITICPRWMNSFESFLADMGRRPSEKHSIDRKDSNGNYEPDNCRWATSAEQANNRRNAVRVTARGETLSISEWAQRVGMQRDTLKARLRRLPVERALFEQPRLRRGGRKSHAA